MATLDYPLAWGYSSWYAQLLYSSEVSPFLISDFTGAQVAVPIRPQGILLWTGRFRTPRYGSRDSRWPLVKDLMERIDHGINQLRVPIPVDQDLGPGYGGVLVVQPLELQPAVRGSRGQVEGWTVMWVEAR